MSVVSQIARRCATTVGRYTYVSRAIPTSGVVLQRGLFLAPARLNVAANPADSINGASSAASSSSITTPSTSTTTPTPDAEPVNPEDYARQNRTSEDEDEDETPFRTEKWTEETKLREKVLNTALDYVKLYGWTNEAIRQAEISLGVTPASHGSTPPKPMDLVLLASKHATSYMKDRASHTDRTDWAGLSVERKLLNLITWRLNYLHAAKYASVWPQALALSSQPQNVLAASCELSSVIDEIWYLCGDASTDLNWYTKRGILSGIYVTAELYSLTDESEGHQDSRAFLKRCLEGSQVLYTIPTQAHVGVQYAFNLGALIVEKATAGLKETRQRTQGQETKHEQKQQQQQTADPK